MRLVRAQVPGRLSPALPDPAPEHAAVRQVVLPLLQGPEADDRLQARPQAVRRHGGSDYRHGFAHPLQERLAALLRVFLPVRAQQTQGALFPPGLGACLAGSCSHGENDDFD